MATTAFVRGKHITKTRLPNDASIFSAAIREIDLALKYIEKKVF